MFDAILNFFRLIRRYNVKRVSIVFSTESERHLFERDMLRSVEKDNTLYIGNDQLRMVTKIMDIPFLFNVED